MWSFRLYASLLSLTLISAASAATIPVTTSADTIAADGSCSLREAITAANQNTGGIMTGECPAGDASGQDQIVFAIPGSGPHQILVQTQLPAITSSLSIDGYTQAGSSPNTIADLSAGDNAVWMIEINGSQSGSTSKPGLQLSGSNASNTRIRGLRISGFSTPQCCADIGIALSGSGISQVQILGNRIEGNPERGIYIQALGNPHSSVQIGGPLPADRNVIGGAISGEAITLNDCNQCTIQNNWIGMLPDASGLPQPASQGIGVYVNAATGTQLLSNWIGASTMTAVQLRAGVEQAQVQGNLIGAGFANGDGVVLVGNNFGTASGNRLVGNQITGNTGAGVGMANAIAGLSLRGNVLRANRIYANGGVEIDLGADGGGADGISLNDAGDADAGPNGRQNYPVLSAPVLTSGLASVDYLVDSESGSYDIELVYSTACDASGHGPGGQILADPLIFEGQPDQGTLVFPVPVLPGTGYISATATAVDLGTSEYSACIPYQYADALLQNGFE